MNNNLNEKILKNALNSKNLPNILIYPKNGEYIFLDIFHKIYKVNYSKKIELDDICYYSNNIYHEFNIKNITNKNVDTFLNILKEIIKTKNLYNENKFILFKNFDLIKYSLQNNLRVIIEKYRETTVFIFFTEKFNSIIEPLKSRFLCLRFPNKTRKEKRKIIYNNSDKKLKSSKYYDFIYSLDEEKDIINSINNENNIYKYIDIYELINNTIFKIYKNNKIEKIREIAYNILKYNINTNKFYINLLNNIFKNVRIRDKNKYKIIKLFSESQYNFSKSYRQTIVLESLLINLYFLIKDSHS